MIVLGCGGREYKNADRIYEVMDYLNWIYHFTLVIHGAARGADTIIGEWAESQCIRVREFKVTKADWDLHGKGAAFLRNQRMLDEGKPNLVVGFPGGNGTADMLWRAKEQYFSWLKIPDSVT